MALPAALFARRFSYKNEAVGWKRSGAGAGGYLLLVAEKPVKNAMKLKIRRWII